MIVRDLHHIWFLLCTKICQYIPVYVRAGEISLSHTHTHTHECMVAHTHRCTHKHTNIKNTPYVTTWNMYEEGLHLMTGYSETGRKK